MRFCSNECITNAGLDLAGVSSYEITRLSYCAYCDAILMPYHLALGVD